MRVFLQLVAISASPRGYIVDQFATAAECAALISLGRGNLHRSTVGRSQVPKTPLLQCHFMLKTIDFPRQARDKHRES